MESEYTEKIKLPIRAELLENRIIIWDHKAGSYLYKIGFYGKPIGIRKPKIPEFEKPLELSLLETSYLLKENKIILYNQNNEKINENDFNKIAEKLYQNFSEKIFIYSDLRNRGYVVRPGLKFGADFAVYQHGPGIDHSPFLVHVLSSSSKMPPIEMVRAGRLATTVRKKFIIATITSKKAYYYAFSWFKP